MHRMLLFKEEISYSKCFIMQHSNDGDLKHFMSQVKETHQKDDFLSQGPVIWRVNATGERQCGRENNTDRKRSGILMIRHATKHAIRIIFLVITP